MSMTKSKDALCLKFALLAGAATNTGITLTGITDADNIVSNLQLGTTHGGNAIDSILDYSAFTTITADDEITVTKDTAGRKLAVHWLDTSA